MHIRGSNLHRNTMSYIGALIAITSAGLTLLSLLLGVALPRPSPYLGIVTFLVLPPFIIAGVLIVFYGMRRESLRRRRAGMAPDAAPPYPRVDFNDPHERKRFMVVMVGGVLLTTILSFAVYNAFLFTESVTFCGRLCHTVMEPEYATYQRSPHARVLCVDCHVGEGASWYVRSKLSGLRQVFATALDTYPRPIPTPVKNLRPARDTCEHCHWPEKFFGAQLMQLPHFRYDEKSTAEQITIVVKTGGGSRTSGASAGIHWHMVVGNKVDFVALDPELQKIPWVRVQRVDGTESTFISEDLPAPASTATPHRVDCMDCHNRPTHIIEDAERTVDQALAAQKLPRDLPWIKTVAVESLLQPAPTDGSSASDALRTYVKRFYEQKYPEVAKSRADAIGQVATTLVDIYEHNVFPKMGVGFGTYPRQIGHRSWPGCFRCHDGKHKSSDGKVLDHECSTCHTKPVRGPLAPLGVSTDEAAAWHPFTFEGKHAEQLCPSCHKPGKRTSSDCATCHGIDTSVPMMNSMECNDCHPKTAVKSPVVDCKSCHADLSGLHKKDDHAGADCTDCHKPHTWQVSGRKTCLACHDDKKEHKTEGKDCAGECHAFKKK